MAAARKGRRSYPWAQWPSERLLDLRICDLGLHLDGTWLEEPLAQVREALVQRGLKLRPHHWLSDEFFVPDDVPGIAIPFYLAHPRLMRLERAQMLEVEGGNLDWCLKILRHEVGHVVQQGYQLHHRPRWQRLFGKSSRRYPDSYRPRPTSKNYVLNLDLWYAQSHPDEDFAETFAVWFRPHALWKKRYAGWPALRKLEYLDGLMGALAGKKPVMSSRERVDPLSSFKKTLREHYAEKRARFRLTHPHDFDRDLRELFSDAPAHRKNESAAAFLRRNRSEIRRMVSRWTGEYQYTLLQVMKDMIARADALGLRMSGAERQVKQDFAFLLIVKSMHYLHGTRHTHPL